MGSVVSYHRGLQGEAVALAFLKLNGYHILKVRHKTPYGEIDIIAQNGTTVVCVEVKTSAYPERALYALQQRQQRRIQNAYLQFIQQYPIYADYGVRFDVMICVTGQKPVHIQNAFGESNAESYLY